MSSISSNPPSPPPGSTPLRNNALPTTSATPQPTPVQGSSAGAAATLPPPGASTTLSPEQTPPALKQILQQWALQRVDATVGQASTTTPNSATPGSTGPVLTPVLIPPGTMSPAGATTTVTLPLPQTLPVGTPLQLQLKADGSLQITTLLNLTSTPRTSSQPTPSQRAMAPLQASLRQLLPLQQPLQPVLRALAELARQGLLSPSSDPVAPPMDGGDKTIPRTLLRDTGTNAPPPGATPAPRRGGQYAAPLEQGLQQLLAGLPRLANLTHASGLRQAIAACGLFFEHRQISDTPDLSQGSGSATESPLARLARLWLPQGQVPQPTKPDQGTIGSTQSSVLVPPPPPGTNPTPDEADTAQSDFKAQLLALLKLAQTGLALLPPKTGAMPGPLPAMASADLHKLVQAYLHQAGPQNRSKAAPEDEALDQLVKLLMSALARTQLHQVNSLGQSLSAYETPSGGPLQLEIPFWHQHQPHALQLRIEPEESNADQNPQERLKQWRVLVGFELDALGQLFVELLLAGNRATTRIWASQPSAFKAVEKELQTLRDALTAVGAEVNTIDCYPGEPPNKQWQWCEQLVDLHT